MYKVHPVSYPRVFVVSMPTVIWVDSREGSGTTSTLALSSRPELDVTNQIKLCFTHDHKSHEYLIIKYGILESCGESAEKQARLVASSVSVSEAS